MKKILVYSIDKFELQIYNYKWAGHIIIELCTEDVSYDPFFWTRSLLGDYVSIKLNLNFEVQIYNYKWAGCIISALCTEDISYDLCLWTRILFGDYLFIKLDTKLELQICNY